MSSKYRNKPTVIDGIRFMSMREAVYYRDFKLLERAGKIRQLELQPKFPVVINGVKVCNVLFDFAFFEDNRRRVIDVKGHDNAMSKLKRKLVKAVYGVDVEIVK